MITCGALDKASNDVNEQYPHDNQHKDSKKSGRNISYLFKIQSVVFELETVEYDSQDKKRKDEVHRENKEVQYFSINIDISV